MGIGSGIGKFLARWGIGAPALVAGVAGGVYAMAQWVDPYNDLTEELTQLQQDQFLEGPTEELADQIMSDERVREAFATASPQQAQLAASYAWHFSDTIARGYYLEQDLSNEGPNSYYARSTPGLTADYASARAQFPGTTFTTEQSQSLHAAFETAWGVTQAHLAEFSAAGPQQAAVVNPTVPVPSFMRP